MESGGDSHTSTTNISDDTAIVDNNQQQQGQVKALMSSLSAAAAASDADAVPLREYQERMVKTAIKANTIILLPTGAGKTYIAADAIIRIGFPALFLVPTIPLVAQQAEALSQRPGMKSIGVYHGDKQIPTNFHTLVSTPKAFETAQARGIPNFAFSNFKTIVFDEVHHVIKEHPYRSIALQLKRSGHTPRIIGLTASLTYSVGKERVQKNIKKLCNELSMEVIEHASDEELRKGGYLGPGRSAAAEVRLPTRSDRPDVVPQKDRQPHLMHASFFNRIRRGTATAFSLEFMSIIKELEAALQEQDPKFQSPLENISLKSWGEYCNKRKHLSELYQYLEHWYEALRILVISWEEHEDAALVFLRMIDCCNTSSMEINCWTHSVLTSVNEFFVSQPTSSDRFDNMYAVLIEKLESHECFRGIIFVKQRVITHVLQYAIAQHKVLSQKLNPCILYAVKSPATCTLRLNKTSCEESLQAFRSGKANLLITTNVAEEGIDIPAANCVIYFDAMNHAVSYVQGRGRARQAESSFVILQERNDRPATLLAHEEKEQHDIASSFIPSNDVVNTDALAVGQEARERNAQPLLQNFTKNNSLQKLQEYCQKTKAILTDTFVEKSLDKKHCVLTYQSQTTQLSAEGIGQNKKAAKRLASFELMKALNDKRKQSASTTTAGVATQTSVKDLNEYCQSTRATYNESFKENNNKKECVLEYESATIKLTGSGIGRNKKDAKRIAAAALLKKLLTSQSEQMGMDV
eukprot:CAMPEP_0203680408 /NCGR_PEP_ID=MMETSP0090-20130426/39147_1 /ASSEMBLY_ACC=CAM_ASM_001088 /TAXON_ID=426623 /ORGANISM="Chaetoceros affinis, Strain CCMP159" /LENGTH=749 /DNA_ID=CAMNT_0050548463 /DNA_START=86 /DNA_END=2335 /DNA_ORIENTATION=-